MLVQTAPTIFGKLAVSNKAKYINSLLYPIEISAYAHQETCARKFIAVSFIKGKKKRTANNPNVYQKENG